jgi:hypothetical protein
MVDLQPVDQCVYMVRPQYEVSPATQQLVENMRMVNPVGYIAPAIR